jgi:hypothetical protein
MLFPFIRTLELFQTIYPKQSAFYPRTSFFTHTHFGCDKLTGLHSSGGLYLL